ncbi:hypothetical protein PG999_010370 [Apiospora kogelbergensis]|uniref:Bacteriophage lambda head decoration protein D n=1 Tax=Apiospora kogelbergensis TaxID=1337665 RepID=A0AAW0QKT8_9PEZI
MSVSPTSQGQAAIFIPTPNYLFSASVNLGTPLAPIPLLEGGQRIVEPITGGTIGGPGFQATIEGGLAAPIVLNSGDGTKTQLAFIYAYGHAQDGSPFYLEESGIGGGPAQTTRIIMNVGGKFQALQKMYILAQPKVNEAKTLASVECYSVPTPV